jgi:hypothetical protein
MLRLTRSRSRLNRWRKRSVTDTCSRDTRR